MNRARRTRQRARVKAKALCAIDFEVRNPMHVDGQLLAYARMAGVTEFMVLHGVIEHSCPAALKIRGEPVHKVLTDFHKTIADAMSPRMDWATIGDPRRDAVTGRIRPVVNDDDEEEI